MNSDRASGRIYARLIIRSTKYTPDQISSLVGTEANETWRIGDHKVPGGRAETEHGWIIDPERSGDSTIDVQLREIFDRLIPFASKIKALSCDCSIDLSCAVYSDLVNPELYFVAETIAQVHAIGAALHIDFYALPSASE